MILCFDEIFADACHKLQNVVYLEQLQAPSDLQREQTFGIVVRLGTNLGSDFLKLFPRLRFVATITTGLDHIDTAYCSDRQIPILSLKGERAFLDTIRATPEHTFGLMLALIRRIPEATASVKNREWNRSEFYGEELFGKTLGIIGCGRVGHRLAQYAQAFDMKVLAFDQKRDLTATALVYVDLEEIYARSDIISVNLSLSGETRNFVAKPDFESMRKKPWIINTSRGGILDEAALLQALEQGWIKGAALDVLATELEFLPHSAQSPLIEFARRSSNLIITPHIAGSTHESMHRTALFIEEKIENFLAK